MGLQNTNGNHYKNAFFGISVEKPEGWYAMSNEQLLPVVSNIATELIPNVKNLVAQSFTTSTESLTPLFNFLQYPFGAKDKLNPNIVGLVIIMKNETKTRNACDSFIGMKELPETSPMADEFDNNCVEVDVNGKTFAKNEFTSTDQTPGSVKLLQYATTTKNRYYFLFTLLYFDDVSKQQLENIIHTIKLER